MQQCLSLGDEDWDVPGQVEMSDTSPINLDPHLEQWVRIIELVHESERWNKDCCRIRINDHWNVNLL